VHHEFKKDKWTAQYFSKTNRLEHAGIKYETPSGFALAHLKSLLVDGNN
jgi:hypothetical protein